MSRLAVVTIVHGRHGHLVRQHEALGRSSDPDFAWVVVAMDDDAVGGWHPPAGGPEPTVVHVPRTSDGRLPLAAARNAGARRALSEGAHVLVFLDVDCLPAPDLVGAYRRAADAQASGGTLMCGPVAYLPPAPPSGYDLGRLDELAAPHPARPAPSRGQVLVGGDHDLFWSLSFAVGHRVWRLLGGFCDRYAGYGGEDTDFAAKARLMGIELSWVGSARAHHQYHPTQDPPRAHLVELLDNARAYHGRWGRWPMAGWLDAFVDEGLLVRSGDDYTVTARAVEPLLGQEVD